MRIQDIAFWAANGTLIGLGAYLIASPNLPFWPAIWLPAVIFTALGGILNAVRKPE